MKKRLKIKNEKDRAIVDPLKYDVIKRLFYAISFLIISCIFIFYIFTAIFSFEMYNHDLTLLFLMCFITCSIVYYASSCTFVKLPESLSLYRNLKNFLLVMEYDDYDLIYCEWIKEIAKKMETIKTPSSRRECIALLDAAGAREWMEEGTYYTLESFFEDMSHHEPKVWCWSLAEAGIGEPI